jgi:hypothetical protein
MPSRFKTHVIVSGCARSGAGLAAHILGAHPAALLVDAGDSAQAWWRAWTGRAPDADALFDDMLRQSVRKYIGQAERISLEDEPKPALGVTHLVAQPRFASLSAARLGRLGEDVRIIHVVRDPRAVAVSMEKTAHIPQGGRLARELAASSVHAAKLGALIGAMRDPDRTDVERRGAIWAAEDELSDAYEAAGLPVLTIRFEELISDPERVREAMREHVGLAPDEALASHHLRYVGFSPSLSDRTRPLDDLPLEGWRPLLSSAAEKLLLRTAGKAARRRGYSDSPVLPPEPEAPVLPDAPPIVLIGRGGSGTRLLSAAARRIGVNLGERLNVSGDSMDWSELVYALALRKLAAGRDRGDGPLRLQAHAASLFAHQMESVGAGGWGWKLPETLLILPEVCDAFPDARFIHLLRHPVTSALRRTHKTSRMDNEIGRAVLAAAYASAGRPPGKVGKDPDYLRNAYTWLYQVGQAAEFCRRSLGPGRFLEMRYEDLCARPAESQARLAGYLGVDAAEALAAEDIDPARAGRIARGDARAEEVWALTAPLARRLGYAFSDVVDV